jgi:hypothetical protein
MPVPLLRRSNLPQLARVTPTRLEIFGGWGEGVDDPVEAEAAAAYGQWADRLFLTVGCLFFLPGAADLVLWASSRSLANLVGPISLLVLCSGYLLRRKRFRQQLQRSCAGLSRVEPRVDTRRA